MNEPTNEQLKELHKDIMSGDVMTLTTEHYRRLNERIAELEAENEQLEHRIEMHKNSVAELCHRNQKVYDYFHKIGVGWVDNILDGVKRLEAENAKLIEGQKAKIEAGS